MEDFNISISGKCNICGSKQVLYLSNKKNKVQCENCGYILVEEELNIENNPFLSEVIKNIIKCNLHEKIKEEIKSIINHI